MARREHDLELVGYERDQALRNRHRQFVAMNHRGLDGFELAVAIERALQQIFAEHRAFVADQRRHRRGIAGVDQRCCNRRTHFRPAGDRHLLRAVAVGQNLNQIFVRQNGRPLENRQGNGRFVLGELNRHIARHRLRALHRIGNRMAHGRFRIRRHRTHDVERDRPLGRLQAAGVELDGELLHDLRAARRRGIGQAALVRPGNEGRSAPLSCRWSLLRSIPQSLGRAWLRCRYDRKFTRLPLPPRFPPNSRGFLPAICARPPSDCLRLIAATRRFGRHFQTSNARPISPLGFHQPLRPQTSFGKKSRSSIPLDDIATDFGRRLGPRHRLARGASRRSPRREIHAIGTRRRLARRRRTSCGRLRA